jgi:hypothetical protein
MHHVDTDAAQTCRTARGSVECCAELHREPRYFFVDLYQFMGTSPEHRAPELRDDLPPPEQFHSGPPQLANMSTTPQRVMSLALT